MSAGARGPDRAATVAIGAALAAGVLFRIFAVSSKVLWFDEFLTANFARESFGGLLASLRHEAHPPLYFLLMKFWRMAYGDGRIALKSFSLVCGIGAMLLLARLVRRTLGAPAAAMAAVLFGLSAAQIDQATDAKAYGLVVLLVVALLDALSDERPGAGRSVWAALLALAAASTHFYAAAAAIALTAAAALSFGGELRRRAAIAFGAAAAASAFWVQYAVRLPRGAADYIREIWEHVPAWSPAAVSLRIALPGWRHPYPPMLGSALPGLRPVEVLGAIGVAAIFIAAAVCRGPEIAPPRRFLLLSGLALLPGFLALGVFTTLVDRPIVLPGRFEVVPELGLALLVALAVSRLGSSAWVAVAAVAAVALASALPQWRLHRERLPLRREEAIVRWLSERALFRGPAEVVTLGLARPPLDYYAAGTPLVRFVSFPASQDEHPGWRTKDEATEGRARLLAEADQLAATLRAEISRGTGVFVAARPDPRNTFLLSRLEDGLDLVPTPLASWFFELRPAAEKLASGGDPGSIFPPRSTRPAPRRSGALRPG